MDDEIDDAGGNFEKDATHGLSHDRMIYMRNINHPRQMEFDIANNKTSFGLHPLCGTRTGWSHCRKKTRASDLKEYGVGIVLYFQFIKYLGFMLFLFTLISIPNYLMFYYGLEQKPSSLPKTSEAKIMQTEEYIMK